MDDAKEFYCQEESQSHETSLSPLGNLEYILKDSQCLGECLQWRQGPLTHRYEQVRHLSLILLPCLPILVSTFLYVSDGSMYDHTCEENGVEPGEW